MEKFEGKNRDWMGNFSQGLRKFTIEPPFIGANGMKPLANCRRPTPQPPSLQGNGEQESFLPLTRKESLKAPLRVGEGFGEGSDPSLINQQLHASLFEIPLLSPLARGKPEEASLFF
jgi:hypothetical protein